MEIRLPIIIRDMDQTVRPDTDAGLADRMKSGDPSAVSEVFNLYADSIYTFVFHSISRDQSIAEDITQEVFLHALKAAKSFRGHSSIYTWLAGIARHKTADYFRRLERERRYGHDSLDDPDIERKLSTETSRPGSDMAESIETSIAVRQALAELSLDYRQVLLLKYVEELPVSEISRIMERSPKAIEGLLNRARKALKTNLTFQQDIFRLPRTDYLRARHAVQIGSQP